MLAAILQEMSEKDVSIALVCRIEPREFRCMEIFSPSMWPSELALPILIFDVADLPPMGMRPLICVIS